MTCQHVRQPERMKSDIHEEIAEVWDSSHPETAALQRAEAARIRGTVYDEVDPETWYWICGSGKPDPQCACGVLADFLCDYPIGKGKTCDMALCNEHRNLISTDHDLCLIHLAEFRGAKSIGDWPPKKRARRLR